MSLSKRWIITEATPSADELAAQLKFSPLLAQIMINRGITSANDCSTFLHPRLTHLHEPFAIANLRRAAERIAKAIGDGQRIIIYGDYDVDGITATTILWHAITLLGGQVDFYVPHRIDEGYGLSAQAITQLCDTGAQLIISVDCGITALGPALIAGTRGVDLIITDHHEWKESPDGTTPLLPECYAMVHPRLCQDEPAYPNEHLCGAGVAFKMAWGLGLVMSGANRVNDSFREFLVEATALAALGTIADVVPLVGENRTLVYFGLGGLKQTKLRGLKALIDSAGLGGQDIDSYHVGFKLAPRLNASGRMGHAQLAIEMLTKASEARAQEIAAYLEQQNRDRQAMEKRILTAALQQVQENQLDAENCHGIVLGGEGWHAGVIGIVASRIVDRFHRPTVMVSLTNGHGQGSGRSIGGFHLTDALHACRDHLESFGGHEMACGLKLRSERFADFRQAFADYARQNLSAEQLLPRLVIDAVASLKMINAGLVREMQQLGPFGRGNRKPLLACCDVSLVGQPRRVGKNGDHLQLQVRDSTGQMKCIAFGYGPMMDELSAGRSIDLAVEPTLNEYNGRTNVELEIKDLKINRHGDTLKTMPLRQT
jgi:single-stranded-DNA-specific exonuclease